MKKKSLALALTLVTTITGILAGCGNNTSAQNDSTTTSGSTTTSTAAAATTEAANSNSGASADSGELELADEQVLNLTYSDLAILDVNDARNSNEFQVLSQVQEAP